MDRSGSPPLPPGLKLLWSFYQKVMARLAWLVVIPLLFLLPNVILVLCSDSPAAAAAALRQVSVGVCCLSSWFLLYLRLKYGDDKFMLVRHRYFFEGGPAPVAIERFLGDFRYLLFQALLLSVQEILILFPNLFLLSYDVILFVNIAWLARRTYRHERNLVASLFRPLRCHKAGSLWIQNNRLCLLGLLVVQSLQWLGQIGDLACFWICGAIFLLNSGIDYALTHWHYHADPEVSSAPPPGGPNRGEDSDEGTSGGRVLIFRQRDRPLAPLPSRNRAAAQISRPGAGRRYAGRVPALRPLTATRVSALRARSLQRDLRPQVWRNARLRR
jgi:hypothetical protein